MSCEIKDLGGLKRNMQFEIEDATYQNQRNLILQQQSSKQQQKGFRKGRMNPQAADRLLNKKDRDIMTRDIILSQFMQYCQENKLQPATYPKDFELPVILAGQPLRCNIDFEISPQFELKDPATLQAEKQVTEADEENINAAITNLQRQFATWQIKPDDATAEKGDKATIDFVGSTDKGEFEGGRAKDFSLELGASQMIPGFEDGLYGMSKGQQKTIDVTFPDPYHSQDLAGKKAQFKITVNKIEQIILPELDDDFAKKAGIPEGSMEKLREEIKTHLNKQADRTMFNKLKEALLEQLRQANPIELPESLVAADIKHMQQETMQRIAQQTRKQPPKDLQLDATHFEENAKKRVHTGLLIAKIISDQKIQADEDSMRERIQEVAMAYDKPEEVAQYYATNEQAQYQLQQSVLEDKAVKWLAEQAQITEKKVDFDKATANPNDQAPNEKK